jgi:hypothetical protein
VEWRNQHMYEAGEREYQDYGKRTNYMGLDHQRHRYNGLGLRV